MDETIEIRHLNVTFHTEHGDVPAVKDVSLILRYGIITGLIGDGVESPCWHLRSYACCRIMQRHRAVSVWEMSF
ncbi:MAG: hypothetical protein V8S54_14370 [Lachnospiraceae bacterium]